MLNWLLLLLGIKKPPTKQYAVLAVSMIRRRDDKITTYYSWEIVKLKQPLQLSGSGYETCPVIIDIADSVVIQNSNGGCRIYLKRDSDVMKEIYGAMRK